MKITDPVKIVEAFKEFGSHFTAITPDGSTEDYDTSIPDFWVKQKYGNTFECEDSNGSDPWQMYILNGKATFALSVADREYSNGSKNISWEEKTLLCTVSSLDDDDMSLVVDSVEDACIKSEISDRWFSRIYANGWHVSKDGAKEYLNKYGKKISAGKVKDLAACARVFGYFEFADALVELSSK